MFCPCGLGLPDGYCNCVHAIPDTGDDSADNHLRNAVRCSLKYTPDDEDRTSDIDTASPSKSVPNEHRSQTADDAADVIRGDDLSLNGGARVAKCLQEGLIVQEPPVESLVVAEEQEARATCGRDAVVEGFALSLGVDHHVMQMIVESRWKSLTCTLDLHARLCIWLPHGTTFL